VDLLTWRSQRIAYMELRIVLRINQNEVTWWLYGGQEEGSNVTCHMEIRGKVHSQHGRYATFNQQTKRRGLAS
jgi:hypothetical protein